MSQEVIELFFRSFKVALNNAATYFKEHPLYLKSIADLKDKSLQVLGVRQTLCIGISPSGLLIDEVMYDKTLLYTEAARFLHVRKIKSIEISRDTSVEELSVFLKAITLSPRDLAQQGGISRILSNESVINCRCEELDYSQFLAGEGDVQKDVWSYILREASVKKDPVLVEQVVRRFDTMIDKLKAKDYVEDDDLRLSVVEFLRYLKDENHDQFRNCAKNLMRWIVRDKSVLGEDKLKMLSSLFSDLSAIDASEVLLDEIITDERFDLLNFQLFAQLVEQHKHNDLAQSLLHKLKSRAGDNSFLVQKIKNIFFSTEHPDLPQVYRTTLLSFVSAVPDKTFTFDKALLEKNYQLTLLDLFVQEHDPRRIESLIEKLLAEVPNLVLAKDSKFITQLISAINQRRDYIKENSGTVHIQTQIAQLIEAVAADESLCVDTFSLVPMLITPPHEVRYYIDKIFVEQKINAYTLGVIMHFFPQELPVVYAQIKTVAHNIGLLKKFIDTCQRIDRPLSVDMLKYIFSQVNIFLQVKILEAMQRLTRRDYGFLMDLLLHQDPSIRKEALRALSNEEPYCAQALAVLLLQKNQFGMKNKVISVNMDIAFELVGARVKPCFEKLLRSKSWFSYTLRHKARQMLTAGV